MASGYDYVNDPWVRVATEEERAAIAAAQESGDAVEAQRLLQELYRRPKTDEENAAWEENNATYQEEQRRTDSIENGTNRTYDRYEYDEETGTTTYYATDPGSGEEYSWTGTGADDGTGPRGRIRSTRRSDRGAGNNMEDIRRGSYLQEARGLNDQVGDPWSALRGNLPGQDALTGGGDLTSSLQDASADAGSIEAQRAALRSLQEVSSQGITAQERANMQQSRMGAAQYERQQRGAIMQQAAMRGMQGSGTALASQLAAQQSGANRVSQDAATQQALAQQRALQAMQAQGQLGGQMRGQSFQEDATRRSATDDFNRYNRDTRAGAAQQGFANDAAVTSGEAGAITSQRDHNVGMLGGQRQNELDSKNSDRQFAGDLTTVIG